MYASMLTLKILHGLCNALYLDMSLRLNDVCKTLLLLCIHVSTDPPIRELQLSRHVFTWLDPQHELAAINITVFLAFDKCFYLFHFSYASPLTFLVLVPFAKQYRGLHAGLASWSASVSSD